jgi:hypothetical protein
MREVCDRNQINFEEHTSEKSSTRNILTRDELKEIFDRDFNQHCVIAVKEYFRRADLIPNQWKLKIGAMHERCADKTKDGTQVQGFTGRMTGYWKYILENGHITGPYRTSREAIENYETFYSNPEEPIPEGDCKKTMYHPQNVDGIQYIDYDLNPTQFIWSGKVEGISRGTFEEFATVQELNQRKKELNPKAKVCKIEGATLNESGYVLWTLSNKKQIIYRKDIQKLKKPSSHMPSGKSKMVERNGTPKNTFPIGKIDMREYVFYNDENCDPTQYKFALRWVKRIA